MNKRKAFQKDAAVTGRNPYQARWGQMWVGQAQAGWSKVQVTAHFPGPHGPLVLFPAAPLSSALPPPPSTQESSPARGGSKRLSSQTPRGWSASVLSPGAWVSLVCLWAGCQASLPSSHQLPWECTQTHGNGFSHTNELAAKK